MEIKIKLFLSVTALACLAFARCTDDSGVPEYYGNEKESLSLVSSEENVTISGDGKSASVSYNPAGGEVRLSVLTTLDWELSAEGLEDWCEAVKTGQGIGIRAARYTGDDTRHGMIHVQYMGETYATVTVSQWGMGPDPAIYVEKDQLTFLDNGGERTIYVMTNQPEWDIEGVDGLQWLRIEKDPEGEYFTLAVTPNNDDTERSVVFTVVGKDDGQVTASREITLKEWKPSFVLEVTVEPDETVVLPLCGMVDVQIGWGDDNDEYTGYTRNVEASADFIRHTYTDQGTYQIRIQGSVPAISFSTRTGTLVEGAQRSKITRVVQWGSTGVTDMNHAFAGTSIKDIPVDENGHLKAVTDASGMFFNAQQLETVPSGFFSAMPLVETFESVFSNCKSLKTVPEDIFSGNAEASDFSSAFFASAITTVPEGLFSGNGKARTFRYAFYNCGNLSAIPEKLFRSNTEAVDFGGTFTATAITAIPSGLFSSQSKAEDFSECFSQIPTLRNVPEGLFDNCGNARDFSYLFDGAAALESIPGNIFSKTPAVEDVSYLLRNCSNLREIPGDLFDNLTGIVSGHSVFHGCQSIKSIPDGLFDSFRNVYSMANIFTNCTSLESIPEGVFAKCTGSKDFRYAFVGCTSLTTVPARIFPVSTQTLISIFQGCSNLTTVSPGAFEGLVNAVSIIYIFENCVKLTDIPEGLFADCGACESYGYVFKGCETLETLPRNLFNATSISNDYNNACGLFDGCRSLKNLPDDLLSGFTRATAMTNIFRNCVMLEEIPTDLFDACTKLEDLGSAFEGCSGLTRIPQGLFDMCTEVTSFYCTFEACGNIVTVPTDIFDNCRKVENFGYVFYGCSSVSGETPFTTIGEKRYKLWERESHEAFASPWNSSSAFTGSSFSDLGDIPDSWK